VLALCGGGCQKETACDGGTCIELRGRVGTEQNSALALAGAQVELTSIGNGSGFFSGTEVPIKQVSSAADGSYSISFRPTQEMQQRGSYRLYYEKAGHGREGISEVFYENLKLVPGSQQVQNLHLPRVGGQLRILVTGFPGGSATTSLYTVVESGAGGRGYLGNPAQPSLYATGTTRLVGGSNSPDISCAVAANQYNFIRITKLQAGRSSSLRDSIYCPANTIVTYTHAF
jgi:hypothetical protein